MIRRLRAVAEVIDARLPTRVALATGAVVAWVATPLVAGAVHLGGSWIPTAASATAGWFALVVLAITVWELVEILRRGPAILVVGETHHNWSRPWIPPAILLAGLLLGWLLFK